MVDLPTDLVNCVEDDSETEPEATEGEASHPRPGDEDEDRDGDGDRDGDDPPPGDPPGLPRLCRSPPCCSLATSLLPV